MNIVFEKSKNFISGKWAFYRMQKKAVSTMLLTYLYLNTSIIKNVYQKSRHLEYVYFLSNDIYIWADIWSTFVLLLNQM